MSRGGKAGERDTKKERITIQRATRIKNRETSNKSGELSLVTVTRSSFGN